MTGRPIRFDQVIPSIAERDAVSYHTLETQRVLREMGFVSEIFAREMSPGMVAHARPLAALPRDDASRQWLCYQASIGSPAAEAFIAHPGGKVVTYHNITPAPLVEGWMPFLGEEVRLGRRQLPELAAVSETGIAVSRYNAAELAEAGFATTAVASLMMERSNFDSVADVPRRRRVGGGQTNRRIRLALRRPDAAPQVPPGCHQGVRLLARVFDPEASLHLVGRESCPAYAPRSTGSSTRSAWPHRRLRRIGEPGELTAYYQAADVLVCCSAHEGFCAPLIEAMHHGVPVVAYGVAAVPETVVDAGLLLSKEPLLVATAAERVLRDRLLREVLVERGRERARRFSLDAARAAFVAALEEALERAG